MQRGDIILSYGDKKIEEAAEFLTLVADPAVDQEVILTVWRNGKSTEVTVVIKNCLDSLPSTWACERVQGVQDSSKAFILFSLAP